MRYVGGQFSINRNPMLQQIDLSVLETVGTNPSPVTNPDGRKFEFYENPSLETLRLDQVMMLHQIKFAILVVV